MRAGLLAAVAPLVLLVGVSVAGAQRPAPQPPPQPPPSALLPAVPAALSVPNPFAGFHTGPSDLYRSPDGSDRFLHNSPYPPVTVYPGPIFPGAYYLFGYTYGPSYYETSMAETQQPRALSRRHAADRDNAAAAAVPSQPAPAKSFYVIPNCYAGDKPPSGALPNGCDIKNLQTRK